MRDYALLAFIFANVPITFLRPYYGLLVYAWLSYMYPNMLAWGIAQRFPSARLIAATTVSGMVLAGEADLNPLRKRELLTMMLLWVCFTISTLFAIYSDLAWEKWFDVSKVIVMALVAAMMLNSHERIKYFLIVVTLSIGFYGIKGGIFSVLTGGESRVWGPGTSVIGANNALGLALNMCLPLLWYMAMEEHGLKKRILQGAFFLTIPAVMFTYSRASALALGVVLLAIVLKSRNRIPLLLIMALLGILALPLVPQRWWDRQDTTLSYEQDGSAMSRIDNWKICWQIAMDYPVTGAGFEFMSNEMYAKYSPEYLMLYGSSFNTHSIYFAMLASHGFPGFIVYFAMIGFTFLSCWSLRRDARNYPELSWMATYCDMIQISMIAFLVNGAFNNMEYFDLPYHLVAIVASMKVIRQRALAATKETTEVTGILSPVPVS